MSIVWGHPDGGVGTVAAFVVTGGPKVGWADDERSAWRAAGEAAYAAVLAVELEEMDGPVCIRIMRFDEIAHGYVFYRTLKIS